MIPSEFQMIRQQRFLTCVCHMTLSCGFTTVVNTWRYNSSLKQEVTQRERERERERERRTKAVETHIYKEKQSIIE